MVGGWIRGVGGGGVSGLGRASRKMRCMKDYSREDIGWDTCIG